MKKNLKNSKLVLKKETLKNMKGVVGGATTVTTWGIKVGISIIAATVITLTGQPDPEPLPAPKAPDEPSNVPQPGKY